MSFRGWCKQFGSTRRHTIADVSRATISQHNSEKTYLLLVEKTRRFLDAYKVSIDIRPEGVLVLLVPPLSIPPTEERRAQIRQVSELNV